MHHPVEKGRCSAEGESDEHACDAGGKPAAMIKPLTHRNTRCYRKRTLSEKTHKHETEHDHENRNCPTVAKVLPKPVRDAVAAAQQDNTSTEPECGGDRHHPGAEFVDKTPGKWKDKPAYDRPEHVTAAKLFAGKAQRIDKRIGKNAYPHSLTGNRRDDPECRYSNDNPSIKEWTSPRGKRNILPADIGLLSHEIAIENE